MAGNAPLKPGQPIWVFDENRRVYKQDAKGHSYGSPIWREHWVLREVVGENRRSYFIGWVGNTAKFDPSNTRTHIRIDKLAWSEGLVNRGLAVDENEIDRRAWMHDNQHKISDAVSRCSDYNVLRLIAAMVAPERVESHPFQERYALLCERRDRAVSESGREAYSNRIAELVDFAETLGIKIGD